MHGSPGGPSLEKKGLRFDGKVLRAEGQAEPPRAMSSCSGWSLRQHAFAPNPIVNFTVHVLQAASPPDTRIGFSREELRRRKSRHSLQRVALGLCTEAKVASRACVNNIEPREIGTLESGQRLAGNVGYSEVGPQRASRTSVAISSKPTSGPESFSEYRSIDPIVVLALRFVCCRCNTSML